MFPFLLALQVLVSIAIIALVLLQQGKGADMGAGFGAGASGTVFGARGSGSFLSRTTAVLAGVFFINCLLIASPLVRESRKPDDSLANRIEQQAEQKQLEEKLQAQQKQKAVAGEPATQQATTPPAENGSAAKPQTGEKPAGTSAPVPAASTAKPASGTPAKAATSATKADQTTKPKKPADNDLPQ